MKRRKLFFFVVLLQLFLSCDENKNPWKRFERIDSIPEAYEWITVPNNSDFKARIYHLAFEINDNAYICLGQFEKEGTTNEFWKYDLKNESWVKLDPFPSPRRRAVGFVIGTTIYIGTGQTDSQLFSDFYSYDTKNDPNKEEWKKMEADDAFPGLARTGAISFSINGKGYVWMGCDGIVCRDSKNLIDGWRYDPSAPTNKWEQVKTSFPDPKGKSIAAGFVLGNDYYLVGGGEGNSSGFTNDVYKFNGTTEQWERLNRLFPGPPRGSHIGFSIANKGFICCGENGDCDQQAEALIVYKDCYSYTPDEGWKQLPDAPFPLGWTTAVTWNKSAYIFGGATINATDSCGKTYYTNQIAQFKVN